MHERISNPPGQEPNPLAKKISKILDNPIDNDQECIDALRAVSSIFSGGNSLENRRNLRSRIERRSLEVNERFLEYFQQVASQLDGLCAEMEAIDRACQQAEDELAELRSRSAGLLDETTRLNAKCSSIDAKKAIVDKFLAKYTLTPAESAALNGVSQQPASNQSHQSTAIHFEVSDQFFRALDRLSVIRLDCAALERACSSVCRPIAARELIETMNRQEDVAYERLYQWTVGVLRAHTGSGSGGGGGSSSGPSGPGTGSGLRGGGAELQRALARLAAAADADRPHLIQWALDEYAIIRRAVAVRNFIVALTRGSPATGTPPIELSANEPRQYVGLMLNWLAAGVEQEFRFLTNILRDCSNNQGQDQDQCSDVVSYRIFDLETTIQKYIGVITEGFCRPLKMRTEQSLTGGQAEDHHQGQSSGLGPGPGNSGSITRPQILSCYQIEVNLIEFARHVSTRFDLHPTSPLLTAVGDLQALSQRIFSQRLNFFCTTLTGIRQEPVLTNLAQSTSATSLTPPESFSRVITLLNELITVTGSLTDRVTLESHLERITRSVMEPLLKACLVASSRINSTSSTGSDKSIFLLNSCAYLDGELSRAVSRLGISDTDNGDQRSPLSAMTARRMIASELEVNRQALIGEQVGHLVGCLDLGPLHYYLTVPQQDGPPVGSVPLSAMPGCDPSVLTSFEVKLGMFLSSGGGLPILPALDHIQSPTIRAQLIEEATREFVKFYGRLCEAVRDPKNGYTTTSTLKWTPDEMRELINPSK